MSDRTSRTMTPDEVQAIDKSRGIRITLELGLPSSSSTRDMAQALLTVRDEYNGTVLNELLSALAEMYSRRGLVDPGAPVKAPTDIFVSRCGGCGCNPIKPCHILGAGNQYDCFSCP